MGLDGFSMGNLGLHRDLTSAQMSNQAEVLATKGLEFKVKTIGEAGAGKGIARREEGSSGGGGSSGKESKEEQDQQNQEAEQSARSSINVEEFEKQDPREFSVRINAQTEMIELFNNKDKKTIETISAKDLMVLISKLDSASGILVNRKI